MREKKLVWNRIEYLAGVKLWSALAVSYTNSILRCLLHQKDCEENEVIETGQESEEMEEQIDEYFSCESCAFKSTSQQGLNIHIGIKHKGDKSTSARPWYHAIVSHRPIVGRGG